MKNKKRRNRSYKCLSLFMIGVLSVLTVGCASKGNLSLELVNQEVNAQTKKNFDIKKKADAEKSKDTAEGMNEFACNLMSNLPKENCFFSPYSISVAMSMLDNGAEGQTKKELEKVFGIKDMDGRNQNVKEFMDSFHGDGAVLNTANSIWWMKGMTDYADHMQSDFLDPLRYYYDADVYKVNFKKPETVTKVNEWISNKTEKMIPKMIEKFNKDTVLCLINAVYFQGIWQNKFSKEGTWQEDFHGTEKTAKVDMMHASDWNLRYYEDCSLRAVELPYQDSNIAMQIFMSNDKQSVWEHFQKMSITEQLKCMNQLDQCDQKNITNLSLPKFSMDYKMDQLKDILKTMGIHDAFDSDHADFGRINDSLYVWDILHAARIEVDEEGSKAAAATVVMMDECCAMIQETIDFIVDQPFIYTIRDTSTGTILFMGYMDQL